MRRRRWRARARDRSGCRRGPKSPHWRPITSRTDPRRGTRIAASKEACPSRRGAEVETLQHRAGVGADPILMSWARRCYCSVVEDVGSWDPTGLLEVGRRDPTERTENWYVARRIRVAAPPMPQMSRDSSAFRPGPCCTSALMTALAPSDGDTPVILRIGAALRSTAAAPTSASPAGSWDARRGPGPALRTGSRRGTR